MQIWTPFTVLGPPPALPGLLMASYATVTQAPCVVSVVPFVCYLTNPT